MSVIRWISGLTITVSLMPHAPASFAVPRASLFSDAEHSGLGGIPYPTAEFSNSLAILAMPPLEDARRKQSDDSPCPAPVLSRLERHTVASGETLEAIAQQYNLIPATLMGFNPSLRDGTASAGSEIMIPPYNGIRVNVQPGTTWQDLASTYNIRADVLFEINGCEPPSDVAFVPGVNWAPTATASGNASNASPSFPSLSSYPLPDVVEVIQDYGWQLQPESSEVAFNSGVSLLTPVGTRVLSVDEGIVAFAGEQSGYGNLIVINHSYGLQTRYAFLSEIGVDVGQIVKANDVIGKSGRISSDVTPFLLFEVRANSALGWIAQDPANYVDHMRRFEQ
ncbi:MAG TPA: LysM peptidoglycan-binding domain-containing M23 family metallopeptidase [Elainellaceae cyanobacterium]